VKRIAELYRIETELRGPVPETRLPERQGAFSLPGDRRGRWPTFTAQAYYLGADGAGRGLKGSYRGDLEQGEAARMAKWITVLNESRDVRVTCTARLLGVCWSA